LPSYPKVYISKVSGSKFSMVSLLNSLALLALLIRAIHTISVNKINRALAWLEEFIFPFILLLILANSLIGIIPFELACTSEGTHLVSSASEFSLFLQSFWKEDSYINIYIFIKNGFLVYCKYTKKNPGEGECKKI